MPLRKQGRPAMAAGLDQVHHTLPSPQQALAELAERVLVARHPSRRNLLERLIDHGLRKMHDAVEPGLKVVQAADTLIHPWTEVQTLQRGIAKAPMRAVEGESVIHHLRHETQAQRMRLMRWQPLAQASAEEDGLARVGVAHPLIECQHA